MNIDDTDLVLLDVAVEKPVKVYLSHSMADYGSEYIERVIDDMYSIYGDDAVIINPSEYQSECVDESRPGGFRKNMIDVFYPLIMECDVLVAIQKGGTCRYTPGVLDEVKYAEKVGKEVWRY